VKGNISSSCPCCGQPISNSDLKVSVEFNTLIYGARALEVPPHVCELVYALNAAWPRPVLPARIIHAVWGHGGAAEGSMRNLVYQARQYVEQIGFTIRPNRTRGYRLERLRAAPLENNACK